MSRVILCTILAIILFPLTSMPSIADWSIVANPVTGNPEAVWSNQPENQPTADILYSYLDGKDWAPSTTLSGLAKESSGPVLRFNEAGGRRAVWDSVAGQILMRTLPPTGGSWSQEILLSEADEIASRPSALVFSGNTYVSYETTPSVGSRSIRVTKVDPEGHVERTLLATTSYASPLESQLHTEADLLWVDWIDSAGALGYSQSVDGIWGSVSYELYDGPDDLKEGRDRVRQHVLKGE